MDKEPILDISKQSSPTKFPMNQETTSEQSPETASQEITRDSGESTPGVSIVDLESQPHADDQHPPYTVFKHWQCVGIMVIVSTAAIFSSISSLIYLPALPVIEKDFNVSTEMVNLTVVVYSIFQGISPTLFGSLADAYGRRPILIICFIIYIGANIGLALAPNYGAIMGLRITQSFGIASTVAIGTSVVGDLAARKDRGGLIGIFSGISLMGNAFGPIIGGALLSSFSWRSIFWFLVICSSVTFMVLLLVLPETNRNLVANGSLDPPWTICYSFITLARRKFKARALKRGSVDISEKSGDEAAANLVARPQRRKVQLLLPILFFRELDVVMILIPTAIIYTAWFMMLTAQSTLLSRNYGFSSLQIGFSYLANGGGAIIGSLVSGKILNWYYRRCAAKFRLQCADQGVEVDMTQFNIQQARLGTGYVPLFATVSACIIFGWTLEQHVHYIVPILTTFISSASSVYYINLANSIMIDMFPKEAATSCSTINLSRCLLCAVGLAVVDKMINALGVGGAFTLVAGITAASVIFLYLELKYGPDIDRNRSERETDNILE